MNASSKTEAAKQVIKDSLKKYRDGVAAGFSYAEAGERALAGVGSSLDSLTPDEIIAIWQEAAGYSIAGPENDEEADRA